jgi:hypothetical protein
VTVSAEFKLKNDRVEVRGLLNGKRRITHEHCSE